LINDLRIGLRVYLLQNIASLDSTAIMADVAALEAEVKEFKLQVGETSSSRAIAD
jgi:hypothetical protein